MESLLYPLSLTSCDFDETECQEQSQTEERGDPSRTSAENSAADPLPELILDTSLIDTRNKSNVVMNRLIASDHTMERLVNARKPKAPTLKDADWAPYKDLIIDLHSTQKKPLKWVREHMEREHGFKAA